MPDKALRRWLKLGTALPYNVKQDVERAFERYPGAQAVVVAHRGPPGRVEIAANEILLMFGGFKANKTRIGPNVGASTTDLYQAQREIATVELQKQGWLGTLAMQMAQGLQKDAEVTLLVARDRLEELGLDRMNHRTIVEIVRRAVREFETELS